MGFFITLEGGEGAGKSTQSRLLGEKLGNSLLTREPGGTPVAEWLRSFILSGQAKLWGEECEAVLFSLARLSHMRVKIIPALQNHHVICDRFIDSTWVYQGVNGKVSSKMLNSLQKACVGAYMPHLTLLIDVPAEIGLQRAQMRSIKQDRFESENLDFHRKLRQGFLDLAASDPRFCVIDGTLSQEKVHQAIWQAVQARLFP